MHCFSAPPESDRLQPGREIEEIAWLDDLADPRAAPAVQEVLRHIARSGAGVL
jgi:hypothetical protein